MKQFLLIALLTFGLSISALQVTAQAASTSAAASLISVTPEDFAVLLLG